MSDTDCDYAHLYEGEDVVQLPGEYSPCCDSCNQSLQDEDGQFVSDKTMWVFTMASPIDCENASCFCLCDDCHADDKKLEKHTFLRIDPVAYASSVKEITHCAMPHGDPDYISEYQTDTTECKCRCAVCDRLGWYPASLVSGQSPASGSGCETKWFVGTLVAFGVQIYMLVCPECAEPQCTGTPKPMPGRDRPGYSSTGEFTKRWMRKHLQKCTPRTAAIHKMTRFVFPKISDCAP